LINSSARSHELSGSGLNGCGNGDLSHPDRRLDSINRTTERLVDAARRTGRAWYDGETWAGGVLGERGAITNGRTGSGWPGIRR
jgi:hypothetical protein